MALKIAHLLYDIWVGEPERLERVAFWRELLRETAACGGATVLGEQFHQFSPAGVTGLLLLAESHISVHTWPETGYAAIDIFTCGPMDTDAMISHLRARLVPVTENLTIVDRG